MKYFLTAVLSASLVMLGVVAYFKGYLPFLNFQKPQAVSVQSSEQSSQTINDLLPTAAPSASPSPSTQKITAGGVLVFKTYSLNIPAGWNVSTSGSVAGQVDKLTLSDNGYSIIFTQAAFGGAACVFPGDPDQPMGVKYTSYSEVTTSTGQKLRVGMLASGGRTVCEMQNGAWGNITEFGHIDITTPTPVDQKMLDQVNSILSSIQKV